MSSKKENIELGYHYLIDLFECKSMPNKKRELELIMLNAALLMKVHVVRSVFHTFNPFGLSGVIVIAESHISIHTWPEFKKIAIDIFSCKKMNMNKVINYLTKIFSSHKYTSKMILRGIEN